MLRLSLQIHKWIALIVGIQVLGWVLGGLIMTAIPIEKVHGDLRWRRKFGQLAKVGSTSLKDGLYDWEAEAIFG